MNPKNTAVKRILADVRELERHASSRYSAAPLEENMFEWHFTIRGPAGSDFEGGIYHGRILLPPQYPFKPPNIVFLTKNGRFEVGTKICLSISAYHEESWQPAWGVRTMLEAIISFLPSEGAGAIGALDWSKEERQRLAIESKSFCCPICGPICNLVSEPSADSENNSEVDKEMAAQIAQLKMQASNAEATSEDSNEKVARPSFDSHIKSSSSLSLESNISTSIKNEGHIKQVRSECPSSSATTSEDTSQIDPSFREESNQMMDAFDSFSSPHATLDQGTTPSLKMIRRRILHSRHGSDFDPSTIDTPRDDDITSSSSSSSLPLDDSILETSPTSISPHSPVVRQPTNRHNAQPIPRQAEGRGIDHGINHGIGQVRNPVREVDENMDRNNEYSWEDFTLLLSITFIIFILVLLAIRKFRRFIDVSPFDPSSGPL